jgi:hypothetical protein
MSQHPHRAAIAPVAAATPRPLWSVMIPTYNCAHYLRETLASVLAQAPGPDQMQIEVVDDGSTRDDPEAVVREVGGDRVGFCRQPQNVGYIRNFATCLQRSRGQLVHLLHGDDYVREGFYRRLETAFTQNPEVGAAFCRSFYMDEQGHWHSLSPLEQPESGILSGWLERIAGGQRLATPSVVVRRAVYEHLGGFDQRFSCAGEDWEMWVRIATQYPVWFEVEPLAAYRMKREGSLTGDAVQGSGLVGDMRKATEIIESYLPTYLPFAQVQQLTQQARGTYAQWAIDTAQHLLQAGNRRGAIAQLQEAWRCRQSTEVLWTSWTLLQTDLIQRSRRSLRRTLRRALRKHPGPPHAYEAQK